MRCIGISRGIRWIGSCVGSCVYVCVRACVSCRLFRVALIDIFDGIVAGGFAPNILQTCVLCGRWRRCCCSRPPLWRCPASPTAAAVPSSSVSKAAAAARRGSAAPAACTASQSDVDTGVGDAAMVCVRGPHRTAAARAASLVQRTARHCFSHKLLCDIVAAGGSMQSRSSTCERQGERALSVSDCYTDITCCNITYHVTACMLTLLAIVCVQCFVLAVLALC